MAKTTRSSGNSRQGRFRIDWYADEVMKAISDMTYAEERDAAERLARRARRYVPVGKQVRATPFYGKSYQSRFPGTLKRSIRIIKSKYPGGGFVVVAGHDAGQGPAYYAHFVEFGTVFMEKRKGFKYMKRSVNLERAYFVRRLRKQLGV